MESEKSLNKEKLLLWGMFGFTGLFVLLFSLIMGKGYELILRNTIAAFIFAGTVIFMIKDAGARGKESFFFDNYYKPYRFYVSFMGMVLLSCLFSLVPNEFWPYMSLFLILVLFSNVEIGMITGIGFVMISVMLEENGSYSEFFMYVIAAMVAVTLLRDLKETTNIGYPVFISLLTQAVLLSAFSVLFQNRTLSFSLFILPVLNLMLNLIIMVAVLNMIGVYMIRKSNDMYMEINDVEYPLLVQLREKDKDEYKKIVHTTYLAERIALDRGFNDRAVKTCSYYHWIGSYEGKKNWIDVEDTFKEHKFPIEAMEFLHEYIDPPKGQLRSAEALSVELSEAVITEIMALIKKDKDAKIDYDKLIDGILDKKYSDGDLKDYDVTFRDFDKMRALLKKEKLYYDFLR